MASLAQIFQWFQTGKFPTEDQFQQTFSSFWHKSEKISPAAFDGLPAKDSAGGELSIKVG